MRIIFLRLILLKDKKIDGVIDVKSDTIESMEKKLMCVYGEVSLSTVHTKRGNLGYQLESLAIVDGMDASTGEVFFREQV